MKTETPALRLGLISDTHSLLRPEALAVLRGSRHIIHAGDVGKPEILAQLAELAPVTVVQGNIDRGPASQAWPETETLEMGGVLIHLLHDVKALALNPAAAGIRVVISGHSHQPSIREREGVLYINPGAAGPRRFNLPVTVAELIIRAGKPSARIIELEFAGLQP